MEPVDFQSWISSIALLFTASQIVSWWLYVTLNSHLVNEDGSKLFLY